MEISRIQKDEIKVNTDTILSSEAKSETNPKALREIDYSDRIAKLKQAGEMLKDNLITRQEFDKIKDKLIG